MNRKPGRHRRPREQRPAGRSAGLVLIACGLLATAIGLGGWAIRHHQERPVYQVGRGLTDERDIGNVAAGATGRIGRITGPAGRPRNTTVARPVWLVIPAIGVSTNLIRLGLTAQGTLQVPPTASVAGWYTGSPRPGEIGSSVIAGHIDSRLGPGVFFRLGQLRRGQYVYVIRANHTVAVFEVTALRSYLKTRFPSNKVYGPVPDAELRLISCDGTFDYATGHYLSNLVAYAVLIK